MAYFLNPDTSQLDQKQKFSILSISHSFKLLSMFFLFKEAFQIVASSVLFFFFVKIYAKECFEGLVKNQNKSSLYYAIMMAQFGRAAQLVMIVWGHELPESEG